MNTLFHTHLYRGKNLYLHLSNKVCRSHCAVLFFGLVIYLKACNITNRSETSLVDYMRSISQYVTFREFRTWLKYKHMK